MQRLLTSGVKSDYATIDGDIYIDLLTSTTHEKFQKLRQKEYARVEIEKNAINIFGHNVDFKCMN